MLWPDTEGPTASIVPQASCPGAPGSSGYVNQGRPCQTGRFDAHTPVPSRRTRTSPPPGSGAEVWRTSIVRGATMIAVCMTVEPCELEPSPARLQHRDGRGIDGEVIDAIDRCLDNVRDENPQHVRVTDDGDVIVGMHAVDSGQCAACAPLHVDHPLAARDTRRRSTAVEGAPALAQIQFVELEAGPLAEVHFVQISIDDYRSRLPGYRSCRFTRALQRAREDGRQVHARQCIAERRGLLL